MKLTTLLSGCHTTVLAGLLSLSILPAEAAPAGEFDFGGFAGLEDTQAVEVNLGPGLINLASKVAGKADSQTGRLLGGLKAVRIHVFNLNNENRRTLEDRFAEIRKNLGDAGWERILMAKENRQDVAIYTKLRGGEAVEGLVITVMNERKQAVLINIVGDIKVDQLADVADRLDLEPLKRISGSLKQ